MYLSWMEPTYTLWSQRGVILFHHQETSSAAANFRFLSCQRTPPQCYLRDILLEVESLSREIILDKTIETTANSNEHGKVYVAEVTVTSEKNELNVNIKVTFVCL